MENENTKRHSKDSGNSGGKTNDKGSTNSKKSREEEIARGNVDNEAKGVDDSGKGKSENVRTDGNLHFLRTSKVAPASAKDETGKDSRMENKNMAGMYTPSVIDVLHLLPPEAIKTVKIKPAKNRLVKPKPRLIDNDKPPGPVAAKVVFLKRPEPPPDADEGEEEEEIPPGDFEPLDGSQQTLPPGLQVLLEPPAEEIKAPPAPKPTPLLLFVEDIDTMLKETDEDKEIETRLNSLMDAHRGSQLRKLKNAIKSHTPNYKFHDMIKTLNKIGIPCPTNEDFARLHGLHSRWDPDGTVIEYFSPMLRSFIPINMRGRYRGCWPTDTCMKGLNISKVPPKRDALEGFVDRGRHANIQEKYDEMSEVAVDEAHLDYLIEVQAFQAETLPIPIFYDMLSLGMQVANECLRILVQEEGYPPNNLIFKSQTEHAEQLRRKIQLYGALGLETLTSKRRGLGEYLPHWLKSRDEIIREIFASKDAARYENLEKKEVEARQRERMRREQHQMRAETGSTGVTTKTDEHSPASASLAARKMSVNEGFAGRQPVAGVARSWTKSRAFNKPLKPSKKPFK